MNELAVLYPYAPMPRTHRVILELGRPIRLGRMDIQVESELQGEDRKLLWSIVTDGHRRSYPFHRIRLGAGLWHLTPRAAVYADITQPPLRVVVDICGTSLNETGAA